MVNLLSFEGLLYGNVNNKMVIGMEQIDNQEQKCFNILRQENFRWDVFYNWPMFE